ncbi:MAG: CvpA family protein [Planctomycetota bacterium]
MVLPIILIVICFIVIAMMWTEGMWTNALSLCNVTLAGIVASSWFEPLAELIEDSLPNFTYVVDYLSFWLIFALSFNVFRAITDQISKFKVRFRKPIEPIGTVVFAVLTSWVMVCIFTASLHIAPLGLSPFKGGFGKEPTSPCFFGLSPDKYWWAFVHSRSKGALANITPVPFDDSGEFVYKYGARRHTLQKHNKESDGKILVKKRR